MLPSIPKHINEELTQLIDELKLNEESFYELNAGAQSRIVRNSYSVKIEVSPFQRRKYYVMKHTTHDYDGVRAKHEAARYLVEPTSSTSFETFTLWTTQARK